MLSRTLRRVLAETHGNLPPTYLLPWTAGLSTVSHTTNTSDVPPPASSASRHTSQSLRRPVVREAVSATTAVHSGANEPPSASPATPAAPSASELSPSVRELLPLLRLQTPHYITAHIHGNPYLLTQGDTLRLPFYMRGVEPGDTLRLNRAINLGSRDYTLRAPAPAAKLKSLANSSSPMADPTTTGHLPSRSRVMGSDAPTSNEHAPHFVPHIAKGKFAYLDDRLFVCRAVVMGVENEPLRIKEKTKRRQRHVRKVKSKHRFTILKIKELRIKSLEEIESEMA